MSLKVVTPPAELPLTLDEVKAYLSVTSTTDDAEIMAYLRGAMSQLDGPTGILNRALITQTLAYTFNAFPIDFYAFNLPLPPLISVTKIEYVDAAGAVQEWASANYRVLNIGDENHKGRVELGYDKSWPETRDIEQAVTVTYQAGYGARNAVPHATRALILLATKELYDHRDPVSLGELKSAPGYLRLMEVAKYWGLAG